MRYISTRGQCEPLEFQQAVETGLAPDRGLYLPESLPEIRPYLDEWARLDYVSLCQAFFKLFATDIPTQELNALVKRSHTRFTHGDVAPLVELAPNCHVLELFHGPTLAFKDFALQLLGNLYEAQIKRTGKPINVLGATSGDTGSAAIHGLLEKQGVQIFIIYPRGRISALQERQMTSTAASNVFPIAIDGSFDDGQKVVKDLFGDLYFKGLYNLSAVNSINLARILAQSVYYIWAWLRLPEKSRKDVEFVVPTGNFGNVLAGWMAREMGLPIASLRVATNQNDILHRFFSEGDYSIDGVRPSFAPSMDIQVASNFERFIYYKTGRDPAIVRDIMSAFEQRRAFSFEEMGLNEFTSSRSDDRDISRAIKHVYKRYDYVIDPHTACGFNFPDDGRNRVILATAHPAKFPDIIQSVTGITPRHPSLESLLEQPIINYPLPTKDSAVRRFIEEHAKKVRDSGCCGKVNE